MFDVMEKEELNFYIYVLECRFYDDELAKSGGRGLRWGGVGSHQQYISRETKPILLFLRRSSRSSHIPPQEREWASSPPRPPRLLRHPHRRSKAPQRKVRLGPRTSHTRQSAKCWRGCPQGAQRSRAPGRGESIRRERDGDWARGCHHCHACEHMGAVVFIRSKPYHNPSHPRNAWTEQVGFPPNRQTLLVCVWGGGIDMSPSFSPFLLFA